MAQIYEKLRFSKTDLNLRSFKFDYEKEKIYWHRHFLPLADPLSLVEVTDALDLSTDLRLLP